MRIFETIRIIGHSENSCKKAKGTIKQFFLESRNEDFSCTIWRAVHQVSDVVIRRPSWSMDNGKTRTPGNVEEDEPRLRNFSDG